MLAIVSRSAGAYHEKPIDFVRGQAARLGWAWDGLCLGVAFADTSRDGYRDMVNNAPVTTAVGASWSRDNRGNPAVALDPAVNGYLEYASHPQHDRPSTEITVCVRFKRIATGSPAPFGGYITNVYATTDPWQSWAIISDSVPSGKLIGSLAVNGVNYGTPTTATVPSTEFVTAFLRWRSGEPSQVDVYSERGSLLTSAVYPGNITGSISYSAGQPLRINANEAAGPTGVAYAHYSQAMAWTRRLSDTEVISLVADPFGWYSPRRETVVMAGPFPVVAVPVSVNMVEGTSPYSVASVDPIVVGDVPTAYQVTASPNAPAYLTMTVAGETSVYQVPAGATQQFPTGATTAAQITFVSLTSEDTGV